MTLKADVTNAVDDILGTPLNVQEGTVVPETDDVVLKNGAKLIDATYVYADMADSTGLAQKYKNWAAAQAIRAYLSTTTRILRVYGGEVRSFDGDRVMAIFIGSSKNSNAAKAAMKANSALIHIINPALQATWTDFKWTMNHGVGIDTGQALIVRGGVRGHNDLVSVGRAPNVAAKLSELRNEKRINVTESVYNQLNEGSKYSVGVDMWTRMGTQQYGGNSVTYFGSNYYWEL